MVSQPAGAHEGLRRVLYGPAGVVVCLTAVLALHLALIRADTPADFGIVVLDSGAYCDEGYKTYDARNRVLFGGVRWTPADEYGGNWTENSPVNTWLTWMTFRVAGVSLTAARVLDLLFGAGCYVVFWLLLRRRFGPVAAFWGSLLLLLHPLLFIYARLALLECKLLFFCLLAVLALPERPAATLATAARVALAGAALAAAWGTKETALVFAGTLGVGLAAHASLRLVGTPRRRAALLAAGGGLVLVAMLGGELLCRGSASCGTLYDRVLDTPLTAVREALVADPFLINPALGVLAVLGLAGVLHHAIRGENRPLDLVFAAWCVVPILFFVAFSYQPPRYFLLALPGQLWLAVHALADVKPLAGWLFGRRPRIVPALTLALAILLGLVNATPALLAGARIGEDQGLDVGTLVRLPWVAIVAAGSLLAAVALRWSARWSGIASPQRLRPLLLAGLTAFTLFSFVPLVRWVARPPRQLVHSSERVATLGRDAVLAGDWAPQLGMTTGLRTVYSTWNEGMNDEVNLRNLDRIGATHVALVEGINDGYRRRLEELYPGALDPETAIHLRYGGREISIHEFRPQRGGPPR